MYNCFKLAYQHAIEAAVKKSTRENNTHTVQPSIKVKAIYNS